jgi:putative SOS response-associated peptidase YedK
MCGRYTLEMDQGRITGLFGLDEVDFEIIPRFNIAPRQRVPVVGVKPGGTRRGLAMLSWGLVPRWSRDPDDSPRPINARAETLLEKPTFRDSIPARRCVIPATGFFEWQRVGKVKLPMLFRPSHDPIFAFAGLWDSWSGGTTKLATCTIITVAANEVVKPLHDRMPAILPISDLRAWLDPHTPVHEAMTLLKPLDAAAMTALPVSTAVNTVANDGPECIAPRPQ